LLGNGYNNHRQSSTNGKHSGRGIAMQDQASLISTVRQYRWPVFFALVALSAGSWLIWFWERGAIHIGTVSAPATDLQTLEALQDENNQLHAELQALKEQGGGGVSQVAGTASSNVEHVNVNTATAEELQQLPGIGPSKAAAIIEYRTGHGDFTTPHDITNVQGIGEKTYESLKDLVTTGAS